MPHPRGTSVTGLVSLLGSALVSGLVSLTLFASPAFGQATLDDDYDQGVPPEDPNYDGGGVDLISGDVQARSPSVSIGEPRRGGLSYHRLFSGGQWRHSVMGGIRRDGADRIVAVGGGSERFVSNGSGYEPDEPSGSTLSVSSGVWTYTTGDGTEFEFLESLISFAPPVYGADLALISKITQPSGLEVSYGYDSTSYDMTGPFGQQFLPQTIYRLDSVRSNTGYQLHFEYGAEVTAGLNDYGDYYELSKVTALNNTIDVCTIGGPCTGLSQTWPTLEVSEAAGSGSDLIYSYETSLGDVTEITIDESVTPHRLKSVKSPEATTANLSYTYDSNGRVATRVVGTLSTSYAYVDVSSAQRETTVTRRRA